MWQTTQDVLRQMAVQERNRFNYLDDEPLIMAHSSKLTRSNTKDKQSHLF